MPCKAALISLVWLIGVSYGTSAQEAGERDPTRPLVVASDPAARSAARLPNLNLDFIRYSSTQSVVSINGELYQRGDEIRGWTVIRIEPDRVTLYRDEDTIVLSVFAGLVRSTLKEQP